MASITGGVHMLQDLKPTRLIASLCAVVDEQLDGWVFAVLAADEPAIFAFDNAAGCVKLSLERATSVMLIGVLHSLLPQFKLLRQATRSYPRVGEIGFEVQGGRKKELIVCTWKVDALRVKLVRDQDSQFGFWIREDAAAETVSAIAEYLASISAAQPGSDDALSR